METTAGSETLGLLSLSALRGVGFQTLRRVAEGGWSFSKVMGLSDGVQFADVLRQFGGRLESGQLSRPWQETRARLLDRGAKMRSLLLGNGVEVITRKDARFPTSLLGLADAPHWLFVQGDCTVLSVPSVAVVGTREPDADGLWLARFVGLCVSEWQCPTVSGLAIGIDQSVHQSSVDQNLPTIAVLGTGIMADYPKNARVLRQRILDTGGAIVTEYLPNETYSASNFVRRNRIQAALARALIPVQWRAKSGTAHTVRFALDLGRPVAGLRLPTWVEAGPLQGQSATEVFTIPGSEAEFRSFVGEALAGRMLSNVGSSPLESLSQTDLFGEL